MPLVTNAQGRKLYVLRKISTNEVLNRFVTYPNAVDDAPIVGLDPDLEYLAIDRDLTPDYDSRIYTLQTDEAKVGSLWRITYATNKKAADQIKIAVQNREATEIQRHLPVNEQIKLLTLAVQTLFATQQGVTLTNRQTKIKNRVQKAAAKLTQNDQAVADLFVQIDADAPIDMDSVWATPDPVDP